MNRLEGKRAVITGGASGLGAATARRFAEEGAQVVVIDLPEKADRGECVVAELTAAGAGAYFVAGDVLDAASIRAAMEVNAIGPAYVKTEMLARIVHDTVGDDPEAQQAWYDKRAAQLPLGTLPTPLGIANTALFLCSDEAASFTGSILHPDGGITATTGGG